MQGPYLSVQIVANRWDVDPRTVQGMCTAGKLAYIRVGRGRGTFRIPQKSVADYEASFRNGQPKATKQARGVCADWRTDLKRALQPLTRAKAARM